MSSRAPAEILTLENVCWRRPKVAKGRLCLTLYTGALLRRTPQDGGGGGSTRCGAGFWADALNSPRTYSKLTTRTNTEQLSCLCNRCQRPLAAMGWCWPKLVQFCSKVGRFGSDCSKHVQSWPPIRQIRRPTCVNYPNIVRRSNVRVHWEWFWSV